MDENLHFYVDQMWKEDAYVYGTLVYTPSIRYIRFDSCTVT